MSVKVTLTKNEIQLVLDVLGDWYYRHMGDGDFKSPLIEKLEEHLKEEEEQE